MPLDKDIEKDLLEKVGIEATAKTKAAIDVAEKEISKKAEEFRTGLMTEKSFEDFKKEKMDPIQETLKILEDASKEQGNKMNAILEKAAPNSKTLEQFIVEQGPKLKELRTSGKMIEVTSAELKAAGVNSIAGALPVASPYAPGPSGVLEIFDVARNPNFITSKVDLGRTDKSVLAWANELEAIQGTASANVPEGGLKPQLQHQWAVEISRAKKAAGWVELTDELEDDLPQFATKVRRAIQEDVERAWDDQIQIDVQNAAHPYEIAGLDNQIAFANRWDAILAFMGQVGFYNFIPNAVAINWLTNVMLKSAKNVNGTYLLPSFADEVIRLLVFANKMAIGNALVGDLKQYKVDIYKDFMLKIGWINDELIYNKFAIVGEMRYHSYISDNRKKALVYDSLSETADRIDGPGSF
jgi:hypothetical protein